MILQFSKTPNLLSAAVIYIGIVIACCYIKQPTAALAIMVIGVYDVKCYLEEFKKVSITVPVQNTPPLQKDTCASSGTCSMQVEAKEPVAASSLGDNYDIAEYSEPSVSSSTCQQS